MKRAFDFSLALSALLLLSPVLALCALAIWLQDRQSPFFLGTRVACGGGDFRMLKFRTMIVNAWESGVNSTSASDRRITRIGRLLRAAKLDEFPQLWNVLKGDMSLVGPRPQVRTDANLYTVEERRMLSIRPGITDLASIVFADEGDVLAGSPNPDLLYNQIIRPWKSRLALLYVEEQSLPVDVSIIGLTILAAIDRQRALVGVQKLLRAWNAEPALIGIAQRRRPLPAGPPPGATKIVTEYPGQAATA